MPKSFNQFIVEGIGLSLGVQIHIQLEWVEEGQDDWQKKKIGFIGNDIFMVCEAIAKKIESVIGNDKKKARNLNIMPMMVVLSHKGRSYKHTVAAGQPFGPGADLIDNLIRESSKLLPRLVKQHYVQLEMWGNTYGEGYDDREDEFYETDDLEATKVGVFGKTLEELSMRAGVEVTREYHKRYNQVILNFAGVSVDSIEEGIYKAIVATKSKDIAF